MRLAGVMALAGDMEKHYGARALDLVPAVGSQRVPDRLEPLERALLTRRDSTCQDLARHARILRAPQEPGIAL